MIDALLAIALFAAQSHAQAAHAKMAACRIVDGANYSFQAAIAQTDLEYRTLETGDRNGVEFLLKAGHGVARLEARVDDKVVASVSYSYGRGPNEDDNLHLEVRAPNGESIEAQCYGIDSVIGE